MTRALVLTYHAVEPGDGPLFIDAAVFADHLDCILESGARAVTASELADMLRAGAPDRPTVAITFDDGIASVARTAVPLLAERGLPATIFCVAGHLGGTSDWPSARPGAPRLELAAPDELAALAAQGFEIGCHGMSHAPLVSDAPAFLERELVDARAVLERVVTAPVRACAYPYGAAPTAAARRVVEVTFASAWTTALGYVESDSDPYVLPRVDAHYLRRPWLLRAALDSSLGPYLRARALGAGMRRGLRQDFIGATAAGEGG